jgi:hypothetical protein
MVSHIAREAPFSLAFGTSPRFTARAESEFDHAHNTPRPGIRVTQSNEGSGSTIAYIVAAIVLLAGAYLLFTSNMSTTPSAPVPATPPATEPVAP